MTRHEEGFFPAKDALRLFWRSDAPPEPKAHVAILHGYGDHSGRYRSLTDALVKDGFSVHGFDYRGHGQADGRRGHCDAWGEYLDDLDAFWAQVQQKAAGKKTFLFAHSHGGLMAVRWVAQRAPKGLTGLILSAPYLKLALTPPALKVLGARLVEKIVPWLPVPTGLKSTDFSRDVAWQQETDADKLYGRNATPRWFSESSREQGLAQQDGKRISVPTFVLVGAEDPVASSPTSRLFFESLVAADKRFKEYPHMRHEPVNELGREQVHADISGWISSHL